MTKWDELALELEAFVTYLNVHKDKGLDLYEAAKYFTSIVSLYYECIQSAGKSSIRVRAAIKALNLKTNKSKLYEFLDENMYPKGSK